MSDAEETAAGDVLAAVLAYAAAGLPVFPVFEPFPGRGCSCGRSDCESPGKHPRTARGLDDATTDPARVAVWWQRWPAASIGMRTGVASGLVVLDADIRSGGLVTLADLRRKHGPLPRTAETLTGGGGRQWFFRHPGGEFRNTAGALGKGLDTRGDGGYVILPPSLHISGNRYAWRHTLEDAGALDWPDWLDPNARRNGKTAAKLDEIIPEGKRRAAMLQVAGKLKRAGLSGDEILPTLRKLNERCRPPLDERELETVAYPSTIEADPADKIPTVREVPARPLETVTDTFRRWLYLPDPGPVYVTCATLAANRIASFDPTWLVLIGAAGSGKTEALNATLGLEGVYLVGTLTEASLLSGTPRKDTAAGASGGLLREIGA